MPLSKLSVPAHLCAERVRALADAVHHGLVSACGVSPDNRFQLVHRLDGVSMILHPTFPDVRRTADASVVEISFLRGRTVEQKRNLFRLIVEAAAKGGFAKDDILIALHENDLCDWSLGRGEHYDAHP